MGVSACYVLAYSLWSMATSIRLSKLLIRQIKEIKYSSCIDNQHILDLVVGIFL